MDWDIPNRIKRNRVTTEFRLNRPDSNRPSEASPSAGRTDNPNADHHKMGTVKKASGRGDIVITRRQLRRYLQLGGAGLVALLLILLAWQYFDARRDVAKLSDPKNSAENANQELVADLRRVTVLPIDENPQVAELTDKEKQKNNPFFNDAQNGDKVLVFQKASKVIIYRPSTKQIVNMATLDANSGSFSQ